ncbi:heterogeneous nuclear ribonucleoprotein Q isoform X1 [Nicotiana tabacum]|uniref:Heterogeneous nuclear ribonucleoprotein Q isoform X1 n=3 Tax=Nicotiana TaxID=4085 RepID=A0A1S4CDY2_TOBAC|nr:PREDICTED: heterogeneous nuclear ribonucleoprotein Q isoform X1 [Nicotiana sylvestris]XP_009759902.1 PREDICTED: heterogeneous nuclear ribonucleoprotein Q isoform X1 [Nicotiana sylvestris]XP_016499364.1 PREDICTED: heterogeneous nuclear ribonucleoprotein Q-like isoform X1 [Nicotiana tabacum]XP_016499365.1 PREDICTED: heterogeneous nuclear ribonucleoprotein Q-like isoform X1 [Nicotiana tabacum]
MTENTEIDDRVDLDDENYSEEDEDPELIEDDGAGEDGDENGEEQSYDSGGGDSGRAESPEADMGDVPEPATDEEKPSASLTEEDKKEHAELLALPPHGSEVFIGGIPRDVSDEDLRDLCEPFGELHEVRIMRNKDTGESKGFAFVAFTTKDEAQKAIEELHSKEFKGKTIRCSLSETKYRLFIGNVPKSWSDDDFRKVIEGTGPGAETIELIKDPQNPARNRGFAFVEYYNNACADYSRKKMASANFKLEGNSPTVTWADPKITPDHSAAAAQVKALYVKSIPENTSTEQLKELFQRHGDVTKVVMPPAKSGGKRDFGFVHYAERSSALKAVKDGETYEVNGQVLEVVLAKPQTEKKFDAAAGPHNAMPHPNYIPHPGYGAFPVNPYGHLSAGYGAAAGFQQQPMIYGRGPMPAGMQMVPMVLPDGQIGYVLQQPGVQAPAVRPRRNDRSNGAGGPQGRGGSSGTGDDSNRGRRYRPY